MNSKKYNNKKSKTGNNGSQQQQIITKVIKTMEKRKQDKWIEYYSSYPQSSVWIFSDLSPIPQGTTVSQRIGMSVRLKRISVRFTIYSADAQQIVRIIFFRWKVSDTSDVPQDTELFAPLGLASEPVMAPFLPTKPSRFHLIKEIVLDMATNWQPVQTLTFELPLNWECSYDTGVNTGKDHIYFATCSDSTAVSHPTIIHEHIVHFHDTE
jgi:hypothetical protein